MKVTLGQVNFKSENNNKANFRKDNKRDNEERPEGT